MEKNTETQFVIFTIPTRAVRNTEGAPVKLRKTGVEWIECKITSFITYLTSLYVRTVKHVS